ncbi:hypothetical protein EJB05_49051 [Eragrostis curvula]|uniref:Uncharacterized protein n=1 Tax=Eragrostis curvula TaxID=38414 RepID=A0A5J9T3R4_9POAL|nr:hypothetical protein EJB05_49051 [Eragrostis curvula]
MAAVAAEDAVVVVVGVSAPPPPAPAPCRLATALDYLFVASVWVTGASAAALTVAGRASGKDSPVYHALELTVQGSLLLLVLAVVAWCLHDVATAVRLVKAIVADAVAVVKNKKIPDCWKVHAFPSKHTLDPNHMIVFDCALLDLERSHQVHGALTREQLTVVLAGHGLALFWLLDIVGLLMEVVPGKECRRIGAALFDLGILGVSAIGCFIVVPCTALGIQKNKDWRSRVAISEAKKIRGDARDQHEAKVPDLKFPDI